MTDFQLVFFSILIRIHHILVGLILPLVSRESIRINLAQVKMEVLNRSCRDYYFEAKNLNVRYSISFLFLSLIFIQNNSSYINQKITPKPQY